MNNLFKKINTLVNATINDILGDESSREKSLNPAHLGKDIDREVGALRQKVNDALDHETKLQQQLVSLNDEMARWDRQADEAVEKGNDAAARYAITQMQAAERRHTMTESDLNEHRLVTQELIQKVNMLEAAVADARQRETPQTPPTEDTERSPIRAMSDVLRDTREKIAQMGDLISAKEEQQSGAAEEKSAPVENPAANQQPVDDDLDRRRQRLSK
jgi:phage shock protein A